ncbi:hypothetical protein ANANG_G00101060 [Anguilla anguilla]|uniref:Uncharacterized protein n=1 Tax=Anguilla anguilla TaxID=7936 RepID=A0A9D3S3A1_ANGAN|nr:hypothetical protein ANANG_G00101060 [Anguilla anguilla]
MLFWRKQISSSNAPTLSIKPSQKSGDCYNSKEPAVTAPAISSFQLIPLTWSLSIPHAFSLTPPVYILGSPADRTLCSHAFPSFKHFFRIFSQPVASSPAFLLLFCVCVSPC